MAMLVITRGYITKKKTQDAPNLAKLRHTANPTWSYRQHFQTVAPWLSHQSSLNMSGCPNLAIDHHNMKGNPPIHQQKFGLVIQGWHENWISWMNILELEFPNPSLILIHKQKWLSWIRIFLGRPAEPIWQKSDDILWKMSHRNGKRRIYFKDDLFLLKKFVIFQFANFHTSLPKIPTIIHCSSIVVGYTPSNSHD